MNSGAVQDLAANAEMIAAWTGAAFAGASTSTEAAKPRSHHPRAQCARRERRLHGHIRLWPRHLKIVPQRLMTPSKDFPDFSVNIRNVRSRVIRAMLGRGPAGVGGMKGLVGMLRLRLSCRWRRSGGGRRSGRGWRGCLGLGGGGETCAGGSASRTLGARRRAAG